MQHKLSHPRHFSYMRLHGLESGPIFFRGGSLDGGNLRFKKEFDDFHGDACCISRPNPLLIFCWAQPFQAPLATASSILASSISWRGAALLCFTFVLFEWLLTANGSPFVLSFPSMGIDVMTNSQIMNSILCRSVTKNLTPYRFNSAGWQLDRGGR